MSPATGLEPLQQAEFRISRATIALFLQKCVPLAYELISLLREPTDESGLSPQLWRWLELYAAPQWAAIFAEPALLLVGLQQTTDQNGAAQFAAAFPQTAAPEPTKEFIATTFLQLAIALSAATAPASLQDSELEQKKLGAMAPAEREHYLAQSKCWLSFVLVAVFNYCACLKHGKSMFQLVQEAKAGDDEALFQAVHTVKSSADVIPYFRGRLYEAIILRNRAFVDRVTEQRLKPLFDATLEPTKLDFIFFLLESLSLLKAFARDMQGLANLCHTLGVLGADGKALELEHFARAVEKFQSRDPGFAGESLATRLVLND